ncbi:general odorant-binding protein 71 [Anopheles nili]|uniref:general odorant-binding protein 71 n=1 Tax=Anopheles nili TaxID=185578 RepID=UPI00237A1D7B|nr:general odorant-binding protein 71 [Anopheles nili]
MDHRMRCAGREVVTIAGVWCVIVFLVLLLDVPQPVVGLRCRTGEGPSSEDVKRIVQTCLNKITNAGSENRSSDEYADYDSSESDGASDEKSGKQNDTGRRHGPNKHLLDRRQDGNDWGNGNRMNWPSESGRRYPMDRRDRWNGDDRGGRSRMGERDRDRDRTDEDQYMMREYGRHYSNRRKRQYYGGPGGPGGSGGEYGRNQSPSGNGEFGTSSGNGSRSGNSSSSIERDRACLMQCFFEELKATNADGLPEKHKVLHVITKDIREHQLREFYIDSIQECFHMIGMDNRLKDKCDYSMRFVTCLSDRFQSNCDDWDSITSAMF